MSAVKLTTCSFSGHKIYPGHGSSFVSTDGKLHHFISHKVASLHFQKKSRRLIAWTEACRKLHKKGLEDSSKKKKTRKNQKAFRSIEGLSVETLITLRNQTKEEKQAKQNQAIQKAKEYQKKMIEKKKNSKIEASIKTSKKTK